MLWRRDEGLARFAMHLVLTVLERAPAETPRWWAIDPQECMEPTPCGLPPLQMTPYTPWPQGVESAEFAADRPTLPGAQATRVVTTINDSGESLCAVVYPNTIRWHQLLPAGIRHQLVR